MSSARTTEFQLHNHLQMHMDSIPPKILIAGLGNPILGDDGVGWHIAEELNKLLDLNPENTDIQVVCFSMGGLGLMEQLIGYERAILIDAICTGMHPVGTVRSFNLLDLPDPSHGHSTSVHDTSLHTALNVGRSLEIQLPNDDAVTIIGIETSSSFNFSKELSGPVKSAVPVAVKAVTDLLNPYLRRKKP